LMVFIINVNVLFLSNSQQYLVVRLRNCGVYHQCQCTLFKQFTTVFGVETEHTRVFIINANVLFLSNSQP
ncbi:MAG: hypothetical protein IJK99_01550, partial [Bacteroidales bacterium]|nr:hypothetical protein [Bacteroidales bacterium]